MVHASPVRAQNLSGTTGVIQGISSQSGVGLPTQVGGPETRRSIIDLHGPDGLAFTLDDPLRVSTTTHNGIFAISYNALGAFTANQHANIPATVPQIPETPAEKAELLFVDLTSNTVSRHGLSFSNDPNDRWETPIPLEEQPDIFTEGEDYIAGGSALRHEIIGGDQRTSPQRGISREDDAAVIIDPRMIKAPPDASGKCPGGGGLIQKLVEVGIDHVNLERFCVDKAQVVGLLKVSNAFQSTFAFSFRVRIGAVWAKLANNFLGSLIGLGAGLFGGAIGAMLGMPIESVDGYIAMPVEDFKDANSVPQEVTTAVGKQITERPGLSGKVTAQQIVAAAVDANSTCQSIGVNDETLCADEVKPLIEQTRSTLKSLVAGPKLIQAIVDCIARYVDSKPPIFGWLGWKNPNNVPNDAKTVAQRVIKVGLDVEVKKCLNPPGVERPNLSGGYIFNSSFLYGPKGKWIVQKDAGSPSGLVETYLYLRLNSLNPLDLEGPEGQRSIGWTQLDYITEKPIKTNPPRIPWPPIGNYVDRTQNPATWGNGLCQIIGDEAAAGIDELLPPIPDQASTMAMAINPDETTNTLHMAFTVRSIYRGQGRGREIIWANYPPRREFPAVKLPPNYKAAGAGARNFRVAVGNLDQGKVLGGYEYNWDFNSDTSIDSWFGNTTRKTSALGNVAICYVVNPATGQTGVGMKKVE